MIVIYPKIACNFFILITHTELALQILTSLETIPKIVYKAITAMQAIPTKKCVLSLSLGEGMPTLMRKGKVQARLKMHAKRPTNA